MFWEAIQPAGSLPVEEPRGIRLLIAGALAVLTLLVYRGSLANGFVNLDDYAYITIAGDLSWSAVWRMFTTWQEGYHPLTMISLAVTHALFGLTAFPHHLLNLLLHAANVLLAFLLLERILRSRAGALIGALCFAFHPIQVEAVAWIASRKDVLYGFFYFAALVAYAEYARSGRRTAYAATVVLGVLSALSKGMAASLPLSLLALDYVLRRNAGRNRIIVEKLPFFMMAVLFGLLSVWSQKGAGYTMTADHALPLFPDRLLLAVCACGTYIGNLLVPTSLSPLHPYPVSLGECVVLGYAWKAAWLCAAVVAGAFCLRREIRVPVFCVMFVLANLVLVLQLVPVANFLVADRYAYVACFGLAAAWGWVAARSWEKGRPVRLAAAGMAAAGLLLFGSMTLRRVGVWMDSCALWSDVLRTYPEAVFPLNMRACALIEAGNLEAAFADLERAVRIRPEYARTHMNRGAVLLKMGRHAEAVAELDLILSSQPKSALALNNRGLAKLHLGDREAALKDFAAAVESPEDRYLLHLFLLNRAELRRDLGDSEGARTDAMQALELRPGYERAREVLESMTNSAAASRTP